MSWDADSPWLTENASQQFNGPSPGNSSGVLGAANTRLVDHHHLAGSSFPATTCAMFRLMTEAAP
ncbi:MAG: hypothetical protein WKF77_07305 [Planctomycetaceae bacterium]